MVIPQTKPKPGRFQIEAPGMLTRVRTVSQRLDAKLRAPALRHGSMHPDSRQVLQQVGSRSRNRTAFEVHGQTQELKHEAHADRVLDPTRSTCSTSKPVPDVATDLMATHTGNKIVISWRDAGQRARGCEMSNFCIGRPDEVRSTTPS
jgi:hypothetical protein